jgi:hypothetical protein
LPIYFTEDPLPYVLIAFPMLGFPVCHEDGHKCPSKHFIKFVFEVAVKVVGHISFTSSSNKNEGVAVT